jgi:polyphosphate kinase
VGDLVERLERPTNIPLVPALSQISEIAHELVAQQYQILNSDLLPQLRAAGIRILPRDEWTAEQIQFLKIYFSGVVLPVLSPIGLDPAHPFPRILNKSLNFIVKLNGKDAFGRNSGRAIVQVPRSLPHIIELPDELASSGREFVFVSSIIHLFMAEIFVGQTTLLRSLGHRQLPP